MQECRNAGRKVAMMLRQRGTCLVAGVGASVTAGSVAKMGALVEDAADSVSVETVGSEGVDVGCVGAAVLECVTDSAAFVVPTWRVHRHISFLAEPTDPSRASCWANVYLRILEARTH